MDIEKAPNTKLLRNTKLKTSTEHARALKLGGWDFSGAWMLALGALPYGALDSEPADAEIEKHEITGLVALLEVE